MKESDMDQHLTPENFIDLVDGAPVEASRRLHVELCDACRGELEELGRTLALLRSTEELGGTDAAVVRVPPPRAKGLGVWLVAVAAILVAVVLTYPRVRPEGFSMDTDTTASETERLLPPAEDDEAFQVLLALAEELESSLAAGEPVEGGDLVPGEIDELTPEERGILLERLAEEMRSSSL